MSVRSKCLGPATCLIAANMDVIVASGIPPNKNHTSVIISLRFHLLDFSLALPNRVLLAIWLKGFKVFCFNRRGENRPFLVSCENMPKVKGLNSKNTLSRKHHYPKGVSLYYKDREYIHHMIQPAHYKDVFVVFLISVLVILVHQVKLTGKISLHFLFNFE